MPFDLHAPKRASSMANEPEIKAGISHPSGYRRFVIKLNMPLIDDLGWACDGTVELYIGSGEHRGWISLIPSGEKAARKMTKQANQPNTRLITFMPFAGMSARQFLRRRRCTFHVSQTPKCKVIAVKLAPVFFSPNRQAVARGTGPWSETMGRFEDSPKAAKGGG